MAVTIEDVARAAGVSKSTVSLVINGKSVVKLETKYKVLQTIDKLGYIPNVAAQELTILRVNKNKIGAEAFKVLVERIKHPKMKPVHIAVTPDIVERDSVIRIGGNQ